MRAPTGITMNLTLTLVLLAASAVFGLICGWRGAKPTDIHKGPRMMPWRFLMLLCAALAMLLLIHLIALLGGGSAQRPYI